MAAPANPRPSRWSDAPLGQVPPAAPQDGINAERRTASAAPEPPFKKSRFDSGSSGFGADAPPAYGSNPEAPPARSTPGSYGYGPPADQSVGAGVPFGGDQSFSSFPPGSAKGSGTGALFYKTKLCTKFKLGSCTFNERCHFAHGVEELRKPPPGWEDMVKQGNVGAPGRSSELPRRSNKPCRFYAEGHCPYGEKCTFSHGAEDAQRGTAPTTMEPFPVTGSANAPGRSNYKTRLCTRWEKGEQCIYGDKCHFAHGQAELQAYLGPPSYSNAGVPAPGIYTNPSFVNPPPMSAPYGAPPVNYGSIDGPPPAPVPSLNPYPVAGTGANPYGAQQDGINGYSTNYNYWNPENKWDGSVPAVPVPAPAPAPVPMPASAIPPPSQNFSQANQSTPWAPNYPVDGGYSKNDTGAAPYFKPEQPQQQQNLPYYGSAPTYQDPTQSVNPPYVQASSQNGVGGAYYTTNYGPPQAGYTGSYNTA